MVFPKLTAARVCLPLLLAGFFLKILWMLSLPLCFAAEALASLLAGIQRRRRGRPAPP